MRKILQSGLLILVLWIMSSILLFGQDNLDDYRTTQSGNWSDVAIWERFDGSQWIAATVAPDTNAGKINIDSAKVVTITSDLVVDSVSIKGYGQLIINSGIVITINENAGQFGIDVDTLGTVTVNGTIINKGIVRGAVNAITFENGSIYEHARDAGSVPRSNWQSGSTFLLTGVVSGNPSNTNQNFHHMRINNKSQVSNLNMGMNGNTISGDITVDSTGLGRYYFTSGGDKSPYRNPITILGNIYLKGGVLSSNGSSSKGVVDPIVIRTYGDVNVTGGNFGTSRGSAPSVSWYLYGNFNISNATLQTSTSGPTAIQKFIFAKQGTQRMNLANATFSNRITFEVAAGCTLDIDTSVIPIDNTGSFIIDSGATVISNHVPTGRGRIECVSDYGGGNNYVSVSEVVGSGKVSITAIKGHHPNVSDTSKALERYWVIVADPSITSATLSFNYYDRADIYPTPTEVHGDETKYVAMRYTGTGTGWSTASSTVDGFFDYVVATGVTNLSGIWSVGESSLVDVSTQTSDVFPSAFFVDQNYPNPFNPSTKIVFGLPQNAYVTAKVYNIMGQEVATLFTGMKNAGTHELQFDASRLSSGIYFYRIQSGLMSVVKRMVVLK